MQLAPMRLLPILLVVLCARPAAAEDAAALWAALRAGGHVALIRHAATVGGAGDPPGFRLDDCATQRNLTDQGRAQARRLGETVSRRERPGRQGAELAMVPLPRDRGLMGLGPLELAPTFNNAFTLRDRVDELTAGARAIVAAWSGPGTLVVVTHGANILPLTGVMPEEGGVVVVKAEPASPAKLRVLGRIPPQITDERSLTAEEARHDPTSFDPTRRRLLAASALAATGLSLVFERRIRPTAAADAAMPRRRRADRAPDRGAVLQAELARSAPTWSSPTARGGWSRSAARCSPAPAGRWRGALVDLWHADERGEYDNAGFRYRGHLFTDGEGRYRFRTILPALYPGRTRHYHVKVQAPQRPVLTTQLYFPADEAANRRDGLFRRELLMRVAEAGDGLAARFDFVLDMR